jgi:Acyl-CoA reductase (LuxC)
MLQSEIKSAFIELGKFLGQFCSDSKDENVLNNDLFYNDFRDLIALSQSHNGWYTPENVLYAIDSWSKALTETNLNKWLSSYSSDFVFQKKIGIILAGNIPLVGFHDFLSVLITGNKVLVKTSSNDQKLLPFLANYLIAVSPKLKDKILFIEGKLEGYDAIIATGSNNTARYFEFYFKDKPSIIRKSRNSVAVLDGNETKEQIIALGEDIFKYFGLGCRSVSKLFVPKNYNFDLFFNGIFSYQEVIKYEKYANNYDYNKAVFLMSNFQLLDNEFLTIKEDASHASPIASVFYEFYEDLNQLKIRLDADKDAIQCVVSNDLIENSVAFGQTQQPNLWDYADGIDTIQFLIDLK